MEIHIEDWLDSSQQALLVHISHPIVNDRKAERLFTPNGSEHDAEKHVMSLTVCTNDHRGRLEGLCFH